MAITAEQIKLLIHSNTTDGSQVFTDSSTYARTINYNSNIHHEIDQFKFGTTSIQYAGDWDYLYLAGIGSESYGFDPGLLFGSNDFTIDFWVRPDSTSPATTILSQLSSNTNYPWSITWNPSYPRIYATVYTSGDNGNVTGASGSLPADAWAHVALIRYGSTLTLYVNGVAVDSDTITGSVTEPAGEGTLRIGKAVVEDYYVGYLDEYRIINGAAAWTANFTPEISAYGDPVTIDEINSSIGFSVSTDVYSDIPDKTYSANASIGFSSSITIPEFAGTVQWNNVAIGFGSSVELVSNNIVPSASIGFSVITSAMTTALEAVAAIGFGSSVSFRKDIESEANISLAFGSTIAIDPDVGIKGINCSLGFGGLIAVEKQVAGDIFASIGFGNIVTANTTQAAEITGGIGFSGGVMITPNSTDECSVTSFDNSRWC